MAAPLKELIFPAWLLPSEVLAVAGVEKTKEIKKDPCVNEDLISSVSLDWGRVTWDFIFWVGLKQP